MAKDPKAEVEISAHSRGLKTKLKEARAKFGTFAGELKRNIFGKDLVEKGFWSKAGASMVGNLGSSAASALGGALVAQGQDVLAFEDSLTRLRIASGKTPEEMRAFADEVRKTSSDVGIGATEILAGAQAYVALTGDMDGAAKSSRTFARVAQATGSTVADIAQTAAALKQQMKINPEDMERTFGVLAAQGKAGAIELKDLASQMSTIAPMWATFKGGQGVKGVQQLGAALQVVKRGFGGDAGETITGLQSFLVSVQQHSKQLKAAKIDVFTKNAKTGKQELKSVFDIVDAIGKSKLANNKTKLIKALGRVEAYRAYLQMKENRGEMEKLAEASGAAGLIQQDLDKYTQSTAGRAKIAWQKAKNEISEAFTPERIEAFTSVLGVALKAMAGLASAASAVLSNVERFGGGLAKMIYGESEEDKATRMQNEYRDQRVAQKMAAADPMAGRAMAYRNALPAGMMRDAFDSSPAGKRLADARDVASREVGKEDAQLAMLREGKRLGTTSASAASKGYSFAELVALKRMYGRDDTGITNAKQIQNEVDRQLKVFAEAQAKALVALATGAKTEVKIGADPIATASKKAPQHARKPAP